MSGIKTRISKLEQTARVRNGSGRQPGIPDEVMEDARRVAAVCTTADELAANFKTRLPVQKGEVVSLDDRRRTDAVLGAAARSIFDER